MLKERLKTYIQHIRHLKLQLIGVEGHIRTCGKENLKMMPFFVIQKSTEILLHRHASFQ